VPYPEELAVHMMKMFSFVGDTVFDPFLSSGATAVAAWKSGPNGIGIESADYDRPELQRGDLQM
jgi:modification methylase